MRMTGIVRTRITVHRKQLTYLISWRIVGKIRGIVSFHKSRAIWYAGSSFFTFSVDTARSVRVGRRGNSCTIRVVSRLLSIFEVP